LIDDVNLKTIKLRSLRQKIGYVQQEPILFNTSIRKNIKLGCPNATNAEVEAALEATNATGFVNELEGGIDANCGSGGLSFSGGQK
jgi:ABC-type multidrug transport system fused ATPase/permease subunit